MSGVAGGHGLDPLHVGGCRADCRSRAWGACSGPLHLLGPLVPGNGWATGCDSEEELRHRLAQDGAVVNDGELSEALSLLERNGSPTGLTVVRSQACLTA